MTHRRLLTASLTLNLLVALALLLVACGTDEARAGNDETTTRDRQIVTSDDPGELTDDEFDHITIDGMDCIIWKDKRYDGDSAFAYSGLTCDWRDK